MKLKRILTLCCMLTMALGMASSASAADYSFETSANPVYYGSTNYEDLYDAGYNYGARNQIDYDIPEIQYGLSQEFLETSLNNPYLSSGIQYGLSGGSATTVYPESDFSNSSIISGGSLIEVPYQPSVTITDLKQKDGSIGKVSIDRVSLSCQGVWKALLTAQCPKELVTIPRLASIPATLVCSATIVAAMPILLS